MFQKIRKFVSPEKESLGEFIKATLFDLTHLEINTIIKDEMTASKAPSSPRLILDHLAANYDRKLILLGERYAKYLNPEIVRKYRKPEVISREQLADGTIVEHPARPDYETLFRGIKIYEGCGYESFHELSHRATDAYNLLKNSRESEISQLTKDEITADMMMLSRIQTISNDVRRILKTVGEAPDEAALNVHEEEQKLHIDNRGKIHLKKQTPLKPAKKGELNFDNKEDVETFRNSTEKVARENELVLDLRQLMVIKKANDIGTEKVVMQTLIGMDGDITTRISRDFADNPVPYINELHKDAINLSVDYWKSLIKIVVDLGKSILSIGRGDETSRVK